jgi:hypothetical protein
VLVQTAQSAAQLVQIPLRLYVPVGQTTAQMPEETSTDGAMQLVQFVAEVHVAQFVEHG